MTDNWPWPSDTRQIWTSRWDPDKRYNVSIRNDALWAEVEAARNAGELPAARSWMIALLADGWHVSRTYDHEPMEHAFSGVRDGFKVMGIARPGIPDREMPSGSIHAWCDRGISLSPLPIIYPGWDAIRELARYCPECKTSDVDTERVAFANRCCTKCAPGLRGRLERPGWCD